MKTISVTKIDQIARRLAIQHEEDFLDRLERANEDGSLNCVKDNTESVLNLIRERYEEIKKETGIW